MCREYMGQLKTICDDTFVIEPSHLQDLCLRQDGPADSFAARKLPGLATRPVLFAGKAGRAMPPLRHHISSVVAFSPGKQVIRVDASGCIAPVTYEQAIRDRPVCPFVGQPMGIGRSSFDGDLSIPRRRARPGPDPTLARRVDLRPEAIGYGDPRGFAAPRAAEAPAPQFDRLTALRARRPAIFLQMVDAQPGGHDRRLVDDAIGRPAASLPPPRRHVGHVLSLPGQVQMSRPDAATDVAAVADGESGRDRAVRQFPSDPMGQAVPTIDPEMPVAGCVDRPRPEPARTGSVDPRPEAGDELGGIVPLHRDLPFSRNRGARPRSVVADSGASCCPNYSSYQIGRTV
jgi:hypothetical protein